MAYDVNDGGFFVGDGVSLWNGTFQRGLAVTQFQSISASPQLDFLIGGTQDNGTNVWLGSDVWEHVDDGDAASTEIDLDDPGILYDVYVATYARRCNAPSLCRFLWPYIRNGIAHGENTSWYPPLVQDPTGFGGQHALYLATNRLYRSTDDGEIWNLVTQGDPPGGTAKIDELGGTQNPISAVAVAPARRNRVYIGYYDGQIFRTDNAWDPSPRWTKIDSGLPVGRPVTALAVHPLDDGLVLASFSGFGTNSLFATTTAGSSWTALDGSADGALAHGPVNALLIEARYPYRVWAGTDDGVWTRPSPAPGSELWTRSPGLPNVAVYEFALDRDGVSILAATHGRGVWRFSANPLAHSESTESREGVTVAAAGFDPDETCTMALVEGSRVCSTSAVDADGAALATNGQGFLVAAPTGVYAGRPLSWVCTGGLCAGGIPSSQCDVSEVRVTCGGRTATATVPRSGDGLAPRSTQLGVEPAAAGGTLTITAKLQKAGGSAVALCSQTVTYAASETDEALLNRVANALNTSSGCRQAGIQGIVTGLAEEGTREDEGPQPFRLSLEAPQQAGIQLVTELTAAGPGSYTVDAYGLPARGLVVSPRLTLSGNAAGGRLEVTERSPVGTCTFAVDTAAGEPAEAVAARLADAFLAPEPASAAFQLDTVCLPGQNPRDLERSGAALRFVVGRQITVASTDPGMGYTIGGDL
jgi:hypothetical protein